MWQGAAWSKARNVFALRTLGSLVLIQLEAWMYVRVFTVFVLLAALQRADPPSKEPYQEKKTFILSYYELCTDDISGCEL
jgi:hypothetical protein